MKKIVLCNHTGCFNRGCDAIIQSTGLLLKKSGIEVVLAEHRRKEDSKFGFENFSEIVEYSEFSNKPISRIGSIIIDKLFKSEYTAAKLRQINVWNEVKENVAMNVGGDTYCYGRHVPSINLNKFCSKNKISNIFWGCSIEKNAIEDNEIRKDLNLYKMIFPRESLTYNYLIESGYPEEKLYQIADPAFTLPIVETELPKGFKRKNTIGINLSPLVMSLSSSSDILLNNYCNLIRYVLKETDMAVALIPHVYHEHDYSKEDLMSLYQIKKVFQNEQRVILIEEFYKSTQMKYIISQCKFLVAARTHASIAGYSSFVPTLVLGYSVKARGIAKDLFGTSENYVIPVQNIKEENEAIDSLKFIMNNEEQIIETLKNKLPIFEERLKNAVNIIRKFL